MTKKDGAEWLSVAAVIVATVAATVAIVTYDICHAIATFDQDDWQAEL